MSDWLIIGVALFAAFFLLYAWRLSKKTQDDLAYFSTPQQEIQATLEHFVEEIEKENRLFLDKIIELKSDLETRNEELEKELEELREAYHELKADLDLFKETYVNGQRSLSKEDRRLAQIDQQSEPTSLTDTQSDRLNLRKRYATVFQLLEDGYTLDEIAERTGKGKGELQLIKELID